MGEWKLISRPPGKKAVKIIQQLWGGGYFWSLVLLPLKAIYVVWRMNVLYNWEGVWTNGQHVSVRVFVDGKSIWETLINALLKGKAWNEETNEAQIVKNTESPSSSPFGDTLVLVATGNAKFPPVEVLNAEETWRMLQEAAEEYKGSVQQDQQQADRSATQTRVTAEARRVIAVEDEVKRLRQERGGGK